MSTRSGAPPVITLYTFGPFFGLPDASPFVTKAMVLLKLANLPYREDRGGFRRAPKGKLPYLDDKGTIVADSTLIRFHIETSYGFDFDGALDSTQKATAWVIEKMCEEHLYWAIVGVRWLDDANFTAGPAHFFDTVPRPFRPLAIGFVRRQVARAARGQGFARHASADRDRLAIRDIDALGDKPFLMGDSPCGADATVFSFVASRLTPTFDTPLLAATRAHPNLVAYRDRMMQAYFPELAEAPATVSA
jgi:glutathione S-transferase